MANNNKSKCTVAQWACHMLLSAAVLRRLPLNFHYVTYSCKFMEMRAKVRMLEVKTRV